MLPLAANTDDSYSKTQKKHRKNIKPNLVFFYILHRCTSLWRRRRCLILLLGGLLCPVAYIGLWAFRHAQCYSREVGVIWHEAPTHDMPRTCPPVPYATTIITTTETKPKICLTTLTDQQSPSWWQRLLRCRDFDEVGTLTWPNRRQYAQRHGYLLVDSSSLVDTSRPPAWSKIRAVQHMFSLKEDSNSNVAACDWVLWMDVDTVVMNSNVAVESFVPKDNDTIQLVVTMDRRFSANSGMWLMRNSDWSHTFLQQWWDMRGWVREPGLSLSGDNAAFGHLVDQYIHPAEHENQRAAATTLPQPPIQMVPRCIFNSFGSFATSPQIQHWKDYPQSLKQEEFYRSPNFYHAGDFVAHASGVDQKLAAVQLLLERARKLS